jgi:hypothetical protein
VQWDGIKMSGDSRSVGVEAYQNGIMKEKNSGKKDIFLSPGLL